MDKRQELLYKRAKSNLIWSIVSVLLFIGVSAYFIYDTVTSWGDWIQIVLNAVVVFIALFMIAVQTSWVISYLRDLPLARNGEFQFITGKMIRCNKVVTDNKTKKMTYFDPVIKDPKTGVEVQISIAGVEANKSHHIMYLKHSKIGIIIDQK
jgi:cytochrome c biogenesis protein CcdA